MSMPNPTQISPSLYCLPSEHMNYNSGVICRAGEAWLIDPGITPQEVGRIREFVRDQGCRVTAVILTHFHWDHIMGVNAFSGAQVIANRLFPREYSAHEPGNSRAIDRWMGELKIDRPVWSFLPQPSVFIARTRSMHLADLEVMFIPIPGHTADQLGVYLPAERVLWAADSLSDLEIPFNSHSCVATIRTLVTLKQFQIEKLIPGHGNPALTAVDAATRIEQDLEYERRLQSLIRSALKTGLSLDEFWGWSGRIPIRFPEENEFGHCYNMESGYVEYGGDSGGIKVGWQKEFA